MQFILFGVKQCDRVYLSSLTAGSIVNSINYSTSLWGLLASCCILPATLVHSKLFPISLLAQIFLLRYKPSSFLIKYGQSFISDYFPVGFKFPDIIFMKIMLQFVIVIPILIIYY